MIFRKKKRIVKAVEKRTEDTVPFVVPQIAIGDEKPGYKANRFVSPIFGTKVKDEVVIPTPYSRTGDLDRQLDSFRTKKKFTKEDMKRKYGSEYPEFDLVSGSNLNEAMQNKNDSHKNPPRLKNENTYEDNNSYDDNNDYTEEEVSKEKQFTEPVIQPKINLDDFVVKKPFVEPVTKKVKTKIKRSNKDYKLPPFSLLTKPVKKTNDSKEWINKQIELLNKTLIDMGVGAHVYTHTKGPTVTRYEIILDSGVNVKKITGISDNIKMALAAKEIRIEAPIPGKSTVGIEVPNEVAEIVHFVDIVNQSKFIESDDPLNIAIGLDIDGNGVYTSIAKMPHGLVAGATGSGKSVCINTILMSLLFKYSPDRLKLMLIDPKMVELAAYNELPHLITPVITDAKIATAGLKWAVEEMESRFVIFSNERVKDIVSYNNKVEREELLEIMPYIVIVVDELADLMMVASSSVESSIMRLTQKARACGIHLIIATQRPSTDVIKGTIKSNIPTRIAFSVSSYIDSMTIIDSAGADKLLGRGDMLFAESGKPQIRVQGAYISDNEIQNVNEYITRQRSNEFFFDQENLVKKAASSSESDDLLSEVARYVVLMKKASINKISNEFSVGFNRAQKIVEMLEEMGIVSENVGSKARSVLVTETELDEKLSN